MYPCKLMCIQQIGYMRHNISTQMLTQSYMGLFGSHHRIDKKSRRTMKDVRTRNGDDTASDHHLIVAKMKLNLMKHWPTG